VLIQYLYISTAPSLSRADVESILASSARNNPVHNITGMLLYNGRNFLQLLEGEETELVALMGRITRDPRHTGVSMLDRTVVGERICSDWAMKRVLIAESIENRQKILKEGLPKGLAAQTRKIIMNFAVLN
jgi:hypothetical protein